MDAIWIWTHADMIVNLVNGWHNEVICKVIIEQAFK
jgi:hypothetical protein